MIGDIFNSQSVLSNLQQKFMPHSPTPFSRKRTCMMKKMMMVNTI